MGYPSHVKKTSQGLRYRVWSTVTDSYISDEMTKAELRQFELVRQTRRAVENIWQSMDNDIARAEPVQRWEREQPQEEMSEAEEKRLQKRLCQMVGADVDVEFKTLSDGVVVLTTRITPVSKR